MRKTIDAVEEFWTWDDLETAQSRAGPDSLKHFAESIAQFIGTTAGRIHSMPSGHQGLERLLRARWGSRRKVLVPAFNCSVVHEAIEAAGHETRLYDFSPEPGRFDWEQITALIDDSVGSLIVTHYFGVPVDFRPILEVCEKRGIAVIEDCAHSLGGSISGHQADTLGDAAIFSFNYDKPISLGWGGLAMINNQLIFDPHHPVAFRTPSVTEEMALLEKFSDAMTMRRKMIPYQHLLMARILNRFGILPSSRYIKDPLISMGAVQAELGLWALDHFSSVKQKRNEYAERFSGNVPQKTWFVGSQVEPSWLKQKSEIKDVGTLRKLSACLQGQGIRAGNFNWPNLLKDSGPALFPHAEHAATCWMDVPIHQNLEHRELEIISSLFGAANS